MELKESQKFFMPKCLIFKKKISWKEKTCQKCQLFLIIISTSEDNVKMREVSTLPNISEFRTYFSIIIMKCPHFFSSCCFILFATMISNPSRQLSGKGHQLKFLEMILILFSIGTNVWEFVVCCRVENAFIPEGFLRSSLTGDPAARKTGAGPALPERTARPEQCYRIIWTDLQTSWNLNCVLTPSLFLRESRK